MRASLWRTAATMTLLVTLTSGCARDAGGDPAPSPAASASEPGDALPLAEVTAPGPLDRSRDVPAEVTVTVTGEQAFTWHGEHIITLTRVGYPGMGSNLLSLGFLDFLPVPDQRQLRFRWAFDLLRAYQDTPGTFTLTNDALDDRGFKDLAFLILLTLRDSAADSDTFTVDDILAEDHYGLIVQPCTLTIGEAEATGSLECPDLATMDGARHLAMTVTWRQTGPAIDTSDN